MASEVASSSAAVSAVEPTPMVTVRVLIGLSGLNDWSHAFAPTIRLDKVVKIISKVLLKLYSLLGVGSSPGSVQLLLRLLLQLLLGWVG